MIHPGLSTDQFAMNPLLSESLLESINNNSLTILNEIEDSTQNLKQPLIR